MRHISRFDTAATPDGILSASPRPADTLDIGRLTKMIDDMRRIIASLDTEIELEENRTRVHDQSHYTYPITAKTMRQRRNNLMLTIAALEIKLPSANESVHAA
jgi:hypothetical protein